MKRMMARDNKFHVGNGDDGKHYWLTPPPVYDELDAQMHFDFDACPYPKPDDFDGLTCEWGQSSYVNPPFGSIVHNGKKKGMTAWVRKALLEHSKGKKVTIVYPLDKWVLMLLQAGARVTNLGDVRWHAIEDGSAGKGTGRHIACFVLDHEVERKESNVVPLPLFDKATAANSLELCALCERPDRCDLCGQGHHLHEFVRAARAAESMRT